ncbi:MarR family transcriptional regulator [Streptomyces sp. PLAI1-29]|uniref:MarR family transcriptional regulator n=2 Tax=Streptomyces zingiberis TaxID=2053010 RepID=A0ABX1BSK9_9ACTN|nr:MarR family transcriptional regulator [Streptomyces zingiberis]
MPARIFAAVMASEEGVLTSAELVETLRVSPAAVSGAIRYLTQVNLVSREREPGSRRERYRFNDDQWYISFTRRNEILLRWESTLRTGVEAVGPGTPAARRLDETLVFLEFLRKEISQIMERWHARNAERPAGPAMGAPAPGEPAGAAAGTAPAPTPRADAGTGPAARPRTAPEAGAAPDTSTGPRTGGAPDGVTRGRREGPAEG